MGEMRAAVLFDIGKELRIVSVPIKHPGPGQVLVRVVSAGICATQILEIDGKHPSGRMNPNMLGHEGAGIVEMVGEGVSKVKKGDLVVLSWIKGSGANVLPGQYEYGGLKINAGFVTTFCEYTLASENRVTRIPKEMPHKEAAILGCAVPTGVGAVLNTAKVKEGSSVLVVGAGGIGVNMINACAMVNASIIIAVDIVPEKLVWAKRFGATHTISGEVDVLAEVRRIAGDEGCDYAFDTAGRKRTMELCYGGVKRHSGTAVLAGVPEEKMEIDALPLILGRKILGTHGGEVDPDRDYPLFARMFLERKLHLSEMITHVVSLAEINRGIEILRSGKCLRVVVDLSRPA